MNKCVMYKYNNICHGVNCGNINTNNSLNTFLVYMVSINSFIVVGPKQKSPSKTLYLSSVLKLMHLSCVMIFTKTILVLNLVHFLNKV